MSELNDEYPGLTARDFGFVLRNVRGVDDSGVVGSSTFMDPVPFALAQAYLTRRKDLRNGLDGFLQRYNGGVLDLDTRRRVASNGGESASNGADSYSMKPLGEFTADELEQKLVECMGKDSKLWGWGSDHHRKVFSQRRVDVNAGGVLYTGDFATKDRGGGWRYVEIRGPYNESWPLLDSVRCTCRDSSYGRAKLGRIDLSVLCFNAALALEYGRRHAEQVPGFLGTTLMRQFSGFFAPFNLDQDTVLEVLLATYVEGKSGAVVSRKLFDRDILNGRLRKAFEKGYASFQVLPNADFTNFYSGKVLETIGIVRDALQVKGFHLVGYVYEKPVVKDGVTDLSIAINFLNDNGDSRRLLIDGGPPLLISRSVSATQRRDDRSGVSPWVELFMPRKRVFDSSLKRVDDYQVTLPLFDGALLSSDVFWDYATALRRNLEDHQLNPLRRRVMSAFDTDEISEDQKVRIFRILDRAREL